MKKFLLIVISLFIANSCFAVDFKNIYNAASGVTGIATSKYKEVQENKQATQNTKQQKAEQELITEINTSQFRLELHYRLIQDDKRIYDANDGGETIYSELLTFSNARSGAIWNYNYAQKAKQLFDEIVNTADDNIPTPEQFEKKKIFISDSDFDKIDDNLKKIIFMLNCY